jgi:hypothetical protein
VLAEPPKRSPVWLQHLRRVVNVAFALVLGGAMLLAAFPSDKLGPRSRPAHDRLVAAMRLVSLSQNWGMYAPDPARGHYYMELVAHDADGTTRVLEESHLAEHGWSTAWFWTRSRADIWRYTVSDRIGEVNRNRTWYLRGVCAREAARGHDTRRVEMTQVYRRIRAPEHVRDGKALLGPHKRRKAQEGNCNVKIIREMIETDARRNEARDD